MAESSLPKEQDGFRWSFDEIRNLFVKTRSSGERVSSAGSFHWSFSGTIDAIRARFSSQERTIPEKSATIEKGAAEPSKKLRMTDDSSDSDRGTRRENRRAVRGEARKGKSEKERDRRNNVNGLFYTLGGLLGMESGVKNKSAILSNAKEFLEHPTAKDQGEDSDRETSE